jgi:hypothetical protein
MSKRKKLQENQACCVCIKEAITSCLSSIEIFNTEGFEQITIFKILQNLNLLHYEVKFKIMN